MVAPADGGVPSVELLVAEAARCLAADDAAAAVGALAAAAGRDPEYMPLHFVTALVAWSLGDVAKSLALARDCHERDPMNGTVAEVEHVAYPVNYACPNIIVRRSDGAFEGVSDVMSPSSGAVGG